MSLNRHNLKSLYLLHSEYNSMSINNKDEGHSEVALVAYARPWVQSPIPPKRKRKELLVSSLAPSVTTIIHSAFVNWFFNCGGGGPTVCSKL